MIRQFDTGTTQQARAVADHLVRQQLLDRLGENQFQAREALRPRFAQEAQAQARDHAGAKSGLSAEQQALLAQMTDEHDVATLMQWVGRRNSSKQRYRLTAQGRALRDEAGQ